MTIDDLMNNLPQRYSEPDRERVLRAYQVAEEAHEGQERASGEPYITHCIAVAMILADMGAPSHVVAAALLHDTVEDTALTLDDLRKLFDEKIAKLVEGVTKLTELPRVSRGEQNDKEDAIEAEARQLAERRGEMSPDEVREQSARSRKHQLAQETLRRTVLAMIDDPSVMIIKLADRLHNMRTLGHLSEHKRKRIASETLDLFTPLANRLGVWTLKWELEDLAFRHNNFDVYKDISNQLQSRRVDREREMNNIVAKITTTLVQANMRADVSGRPKHIYSIYRKMVRKSLPFEEVHDLRGVRILVSDIPECYMALGAIHTHWHPIPGQFDDYIAAPKDNFYRSLHTAVVFDDGRPLEVQIRTREMHSEAENGIASHWRYKEGMDRDAGLEQRIMMMRSLTDWKDDTTSTSEFLSSLKVELSEERVYAFTPKGDVIDLPAGSTPIDFAYHVHTEIGHRCRGARINGTLVSLDYHLRTGDRVEILTQKRGGPSRDWLNASLGMATTQRARSKIRHWFQRQEREQNVLQGRDVLERELHRLGVGEVNLENIAGRLDYRSLDDLYVALSTGEISTTRLASALMEGEKDDEGVPFGDRVPTAPSIQSHDTIAVVGLHGILTNMARCCSPVPGDPIVGYITRGRGATIHRRDCPNVFRLSDRERLVQVNWGQTKRTYPVSVRIRAFDRDGLMRDVSNLISNEGINMGAVKGGVEHTNKYNMADFRLILDVRDAEQLARVLTRVETLPNILEAHRIRPG